MVVSPYANRGGVGEDFKKALMKGTLCYKM